MITHNLEALVPKIVEEMGIMNVEQLKTNIEEVFSSMKEEATYYNNEEQHELQRRLMEALN